MSGSGNNPVPILSENQSIVRERTHQTYSVYKFLADDPASLLFRLGAVRIYLGGLEEGAVENL